MARPGDVTRPGDVARPSVVGVDVGGTFTDCIVFDGRTGSVLIAKLPTTLEDQSIAVVDGIGETGVDIGDLVQVVHGTTTATNATIERTGGRAALVTTRGFRDVVELGRRDRPHLYGLRGSFTPLIPRRHRFEVGGRMGPDGEEVEALTDEELARLVDEVGRLDVESVAICLFHSYANDDHERRVEEALREADPSTYVIRSTALYPEIGEFERTSTTVIAAYVGPTVDRYLRRLDDRLRGEGFGRDYMVVQSNGGAATFRVATRLPTATIMSGPAAGITAARAVARAAGMDRAVSFDMGGTSADVAVIVDDRVRQSTANDLGFRLSLQVPMLEIDSIGAGGGSVASIDDAGILRVGPRSAGSVPGPACYGRGGTEPTVTDAHMALGHVPLESLARNRIAAVRPDAARQALATAVAGPLGLEVEEAAEAVLEVVTENMAGQIRLATVDQGLDVRDFGLITFGGAGPLHVCGLMRKLGIARAAVPVFPGLTSALGALMTDVRHDFVHAVRRPLADVELEELQRVVKEHRAAGDDLLRSQGFDGATSHDLAVSMLYRGQRHPVTVDLAAEALGATDLAEAFAGVYATQYGDTLDRPVEITSLRSSVAAPVEGLDLASCARALHEAEPSFEEYETTARFGGEDHATRVLDRSSLTIGAPIAGPAVIVQRDTTTLVEPGFEGVETDAGSFEITRTAAT